MEKGSVTVPFFITNMIDFSRLYRLYDNAKKLTDEKLWTFALNDKFVQDEIIKMNTIDQLFDEGIDSTGASLGEYSPFTINLKRKKQQPTDRVTLYDEGDFYNSFVIVVGSSFFDIEADDFSKYDRPLFEVYGEDVAGLTDFNKQRLKEILLVKYVEYIRRTLLS